MKTRQPPTKLLMLGAAFVLVTAGGLWLANTLKQPREKKPDPVEETVGPYKRAELLALIAQLSSTNEADRKQAEKDLASAGAFALNELQAAEAMATGPAKEAIVRLRNRARFMGLKNLDYAAAFPANAMGVVNAKNVQETLDKAKKTAFGRLLQRPAFDALKVELLKTLERENAADLPVEYFKGQIAAAVFPTGPGRIEQMGKFGLLLELRGADPQGEYLEWSRKLLNAGGSIVTYKDIETFESGPGKGAYTRTGSNVLLGSDPQALHMLIDSVLDGLAIGANEDVQKIRAVQKDPDVLALIDVPAIFHQALLYGDANAKKAENALMLFLINRIGFASISGRCVGDGFEDKLLWLLPEGPSTIAPALTAPPGSPAPVDALDAVPSNAIAAAVLYVDGASLEKTLTNLYNDMKKIRGAADEPNPFDLLREMERQLSLKPGELMGHIKGELGIWLTPKAGGDWNDVDIAAMLTAPDERSAEQIAMVLDRMHGGKPNNVFTKSTHLKHVLRSDASTNFNYTPHGKRLYMANSLDALKKQAEHLERNSAGLLRRDPLQKAIATFTPEERRGAVIYLDAQVLLTRMAEQMAPGIQASAETPPLVKEAFKKLPPPIDLFKDFPPLISMTSVHKDRVEWVIHSPLPLVPIGIAAILGTKKETNIDLGQPSKKTP